MTCHLPQVSDRSMSSKNCVDNLYIGTVGQQWPLSTTQVSKTSCCKRTALINTNKGILHLLLRSSCLAFITRSRRSIVIGHRLLGRDGKFVALRWAERGQLRRNCEYCILGCDTPGAHEVRDSLQQCELIVDNSIAWSEVSERCGMTTARTVEVKGPKVNG